MKAALRLGLTAAALLALAALADRLYGGGPKVKLRGDRPVGDEWCDEEADQRPTDGVWVLWWRPEPSGRRRKPWRPIGTPATREEVEHRATLICGDGSVLIFPEGQHPYGEKPAAGATPEAA